MLMNVKRYSVPLLLSLCLTGAEISAAPALDPLRALGATPANGTYTIQWNAAALNLLGVASSAAPRRGYQSETGTLLDDTALPLEFGASGWPAFALDLSGSGPLLSTPQPLLSLPGAPASLRLRARGDGHSFSLSDQNHALWLIASHAQPSFDPSTERLWIRNLDLRVGPALAAAVRSPALEGQVVGGMALTLRGTGNASAPAGITCSSPQYQPRWPTLGFRADVALTQIGSVQMLRCETCTASSTDGLLALAPSARLRNVGDADIPWAPKFIDVPLPPYGGDQHPFLAWNVYRLEASGQLKQIAASGFKHAFVSTSLNCPCPSGYILYGSCEDVYGAFTNDIYNILSPRTELIPYRGLWARCGSIYDPDCNGVQNFPAGAPDDYTWRASFSEAQLGISGARYFADAWYVVREDANIDNSMGVVEILPTKTNAAWTFPQLGTISAGSILERLIATLQPTDQHLYSRQQTGEGRVDTLSVVRAVAGGYRYTVYVANLEWMRTRTSGAFPNLRLLETAGIQQLRVPLPNAIASAAVATDADAIAINDWTTTLSPSALLFDAPSGDVGQLWGTVYRYEWTSASAPALGWVEATAGRDTLARTVLLTALLPGGNSLDLIQRNGFETSLASFDADKDTF